ncbi:unnamed protein product [Linum trigynum]|uniref:Transmembrane protein n=1 Tax=Linum trigynum TaxID=586398 RepID=A0AAV2DAT8_9ROSI
MEIFSKLKAKVVLFAIHIAATLVFFPILVSEGMASPYNPERVDRGGKEKDHEDEVMDRSVDEELSITTVKVGYLMKHSRQQDFAKRGNFA